ncbi:hypothetical protein [Vibrio parahaemolyticus]|uniref:hypothetical protein n=1 Tax=Vibrio parahaemolyticus TaxID=670 RepID=UPI00111EBD80|nr:hypothetical protein [Vibrio parahaemolyticus]TOA25361.1 hypothetical protein CGK31_07625 [Vibrio parahaemolyticus]
MFEKFTLAERDYWFIRSGKNSGEFFKHFKDSGLIAIGHADSFGLDFEDSHVLTDNEKLQVLATALVQMNNEARTPSEIGSSKRQLERFLTHISKDDIILTTNSDNQILAGKVTSSAYFGTTVILPTHERDEAPKECHYNLRINVDWGKVKDRKLLPYVVDKTLRSPLTVSQLDKPEQLHALNHWLFPIHFTESEARCTLKISTTQDIQNRDLSKLSLALDELELLSEYLSANDSFNLAEYQDFANANRDIYQYTITAQHVFMSPGHQNIQVFGSLRKQQIFALLLTAIFATAPLNASEQDEYNTVINAQHIEVARNFVSEIYQLNSIKQNLEVIVPKGDFSPSVEETDDEFAPSIPDDHTIL